MHTSHTGGGIDGFTTYLSYYPDQDLTIAVLLNLENGNPMDIERAIAGGNIDHPVSQSDAVGSMYGEDATDVLKRLSEKENVARASFAGVYMNYRK